MENSQLEQSLLAILDKSVAGIEAAGDFMIGEIPEVAAQLLTWHALESFIWFSFWLVLTGVSAFKIVKWTPAIKEFDKGGYVILLAVLWSCVIALFAVTASCTSWLKILVAPKLYLLEYAAALIK